MISFPQKPRKMRYLIPLAIFAMQAMVLAKTHAKPRSMAVDTTFDQCGWAAEVTIIDVGDTIRVRVTEDANTIYRGYQLMGRVVEVQPIAGGDATCQSDLLQFAGKRTKLLMVTNQEGQVQLVGAPQTVDDVDGYHLRTWFDYNATWFYANDKEFGRAVGDSFDGVYAVTRQQVAARFRDERERLTLAIASILVRPRVELPENDLQQIIVQLGDDEFYVREAAQRRLLSLDISAVEFLKQQAEATDDLEISNRLRQIVRAIQSPLQRHALTIRDRGAKDEARILLQAHDATDAESVRSPIIARLNVLAKEENLSVSSDVVAQWRKAVE